MGPTIKDGNIELEELYTPDEAVKPGGILRDVTLRLRMHNNFEAPITDLDLCQKSENPCSSGIDEGYCGSGRFFLEGDQEILPPECLHIPLPGESYNIDLTADLQAPSTIPSLGDLYVVEADVAMTATETISPALTDPIIISETGADEVTTDPPAMPDPPADSPDLPGVPGNGGDLIPEDLGRTLLLLGAGYVVLKTVSETATEEAFD